jgi:hypothetical protein
VGSIIFTLRILAEAIFAVPGAEHVSNYKIYGTLVIWMPCGLALAFSRWQAKEREYAAAVAKRVAETELNQALQHNDPSSHASCLRTPRASRGRG